MADELDLMNVRPHGDRDESEETKLSKETLRISDETRVVEHAHEGATVRQAEFGRYRLIREIGAGGQGQVYLAEDRELHRQVALKVLVRGAHVSEMARMRFRREAEVASKLNHPNICTVYEFGEFEGILFMAMQFVDGEVLGDRIKKSAAQEACQLVILPGDSKPSRDRSETGSRSRSGALHRVIRFVESIARALHAAHEAGLVHRDMKTGNVMVDREGKPVILDFGLARDENETGFTLTQSGDILGTPAYMAPEQLTQGGTHVDARADVFALGVVLYECLTLKRPFVGHSLDAIYQAILGKEPVRPRALNPAIPRDLEVVVQTALEKDRGRRYQSALDLAEDLRRVRQLEPIRARPAGPVLRLKRWAQRRPAVAALLVVLVLALPTIAALTTRHLAMLPQVRKQEAAELRAKVEDLIADGLILTRFGYKAEGLKKYEEALRLDPGSAEAVGMMALVLVVGDAPRALALLTAHPDLEVRQPYLASLRARALRELGREVEADEIMKTLTEPADHVAWYLKGQGELAAGKAGDKSAYERALDSLLTAAMASPVARALYHYNIAEVLGKLGGPADPVLVDRTVRVLTTVWREDARAWFWAAWACPGDAQRATSLLREAIRLDPDYMLAYRNLGVMLNRQGRSDEAADLLREALQRNPRWADLHSLLGQALALQEKHEEALVEMRKGLGRDPNDAAMHTDFGLSLAALGRFDEALAAYRTSMRLDPKYAKAHQALGVMLAGQGKIEEAVAAYREAVRLDPDVVEARVSLGKALAKLGQATEAEKVLRAAIDRDPRYVKSYKALGRLLESGGRLEESIEVFREIVRQRPDDASARNDLGVAFWTAGRLEEAVDTYREAIRLDPGEAIAWQNLGATLQQQERHEEASAAFRECIRLQPGNFEPRFRLVGNLRKMGRSEEALTVLQKAVEDFPESPDAYDQFAWQLGELQRYEESAEAYRVFIRLAPGNARAHHAMAWVLEHMGRLDEAAAALRECLRIAPETADARFYLGEILNKQGKSEDALAVFREAVRVHPADARSHQYLGVELARQGRFEEAIAAFRRAIELAPPFIESTRKRLRSAVLGRVQELLAEQERTKALEILFSVADVLPNDAQIGRRIEEIEKDR